MRVLFLMALFAVSQTGAGFRKGCSMTVTTGPTVLAIAAISPVVLS